MLRARSASDRDASVASFFEDWKMVLAAADRDTYYRAETARYLDNLYSMCALHAFLALNMFTREAGAPLVERMRRSKFASTSLCIDFVCHFATDQKTGALAGRIA